MLIDEAHAASEHDALDRAVADKREGRLRAAVSRQTPMQRQVFTLRVADGLSYKEIATVLGSPRAIARALSQRAACDQGDAR